MTNSKAFIIVNPLGVNLIHTCRDSESRCRSDFARMMGFAYFKTIESKGYKCISVIIITDPVLSDQLSKNPCLLS